MWKIIINWYLSKVFWYQIFCNGTGKKKCTLIQALRLCTGRTADRVVEVKLYSFLPTTLEGGEGSESRPGRSLPPKRPGTHSTGGWVGPKAGLDRKNLVPTGIRSRTVQPVVSRYTDWVTGPTMCFYLFIWNVFQSKHNYILSIIRVTTSSWGQ